MEWILLRIINPLLNYKTIPLGHNFCVFFISIPVRKHLEYLLLHCQKVSSAKILLLVCFGNPLLPCAGLKLTFA